MWVQYKRREVLFFYFFINVLALFTAYYIVRMGGQGDPGGYEDVFWNKPNNKGY